MIPHLSASRTEHASNTSQNSSDKAEASGFASLMPEFYATPVHQEGLGFITTKYNLRLAEQLMHHRRLNFINP